MSASTQYHNSVVVKINLYCDLLLKRVNSGDSGYTEDLLEMARKGVEVKRSELIEANLAHFDMVSKLNSEIRRLQ